MQDQLREQIRYLHYSLRTEEASACWIKNFIHFHNLKHPRDMRQALIVWLFLCPKVLGTEAP